MKEGLFFTVLPDSDGCRLDRFLRKMHPEMPSKSVSFAIGAGEVYVNRERAKKGRALRAGDEVRVRRIAENADWLPLPAELPGAGVLYEDMHVAVLSKPADAHTEPQRPWEKGTLAGHLLFRHPEVSGISGDPGLTLLTRLDYATSGAVPAALSPEAFEILQREREKGRIGKTYACLVHGSLEKEIALSYLLETQGGERVRVRKDIVEKDPRYWTIVTPVRQVGAYTLVRAAISKGKRHQIRAHLAAAGYPIVGDRRYSAVPAEGPGLSRLMLHAEEVRFTHPATNEHLRVVAPLPEEFGAI